MTASSLCLTSQTCAYCLQYRSLLQNTHHFSSIQLTVSFAPRNKETSRDEFIFYSKRLMRLLIEHALSFLPLKVSGPSLMTSHKLLLPAVTSSGYWPRNTAIHMSVR